MAGQAKIKIFGEDLTAAAWNSAIGRATTSVNKISGLFKVAFAGAAVAAIGRLGADAIKLGDDLNKAAIKAGIGGKAMSELAYAAKMADVEIGGLSTGLKKMQVALSEAATGAKGPNQALAALGLTIERLKGLKADEQFAMIGDRISKLPSAADKARAAVELFGKAGADLLPLFSEGAEGLAKARKEAERLGLAFDDEKLAKLAAADDAIKRLDASWQGFWVTLTSKVAPALSWTLDRLAGVPKDINEQIADLEDTLNDKANAPFFAMQPAEKQRLQQELRKLREQSLKQSMSDMGVATGVTPGHGRNVPGGYGGSVGEVPGYEAATKDAQDALDDLTSDERALYDMQYRMSDQIADEMREGWEEEAERVRDAQKFYEELDEQRIEDQRKLNELHEQQAKQLSENGQIFKDAFLNAWDDWIHTGKFKVDELFKYILAQFARRGIAKLFDMMFGGSGGGSSSSSSIFGGLGSIFGGGGGSSGGWNPIMNFGGGRAAGGPVESGKFYRVGENGPELLLAGSSGSIVPNGASGGRVVVNYNIDARGADQGLITRLPAILKAHGEATKADLIAGIRSGRYPI